MYRRNLVPRKLGDSHRQQFPANHTTPLHDNRVRPQYNEGPPFGGWYVTWKCLRLRHCPKNEYLAKNRSLKEKFKNLKIISQPGTLSADIPASQKRFYSIYNPPIHFRIAAYLLTFLYFPEQHLRSAYLNHYKTVRFSSRVEGNCSTTFLEWFSQSYIQIFVQGKRLKCKLKRLKRCILMEQDP